MTLKLGLEKNDHQIFTKLTAFFQAYDLFCGKLF